MGRLTIDNGTEHDAVAALFLADKPRAAVYIRAGQTATIQRIPAGTYTLRFSTGTDWDSATLRFRCDARFSEFSEPLEFGETKTSEGTRFMAASVTLHAVPSGNAPTEPIDGADFDLKKMSAEGDR